MERVRSLTQQLTDEQLKNRGVYVAKFMSFERAIELFQKDYNDNSVWAEDDPQGYRVTNQGIEIIY